MYTIVATVDGEQYPLHNPRSRDLIVGDPYFEIGDNINGQAEFKVFPNHPYYDLVKKLTTEIIFLNNEKEEFRGRVLYDNESFDGTKEVFVEGQLAYLCDSVQRPKVYHNISVKGYLQDLLDNHNMQVEERKQFQLGRVSVVDSNDSLYRYSNYNDTRFCIKDKLTDRLGGHLGVRWVNGIRFLDYLSDTDFYEKSDQAIEFGKNLLDYSKNMDATNLATCIIPLGARLDEEEQDPTLQEQRVTITSVNGGVDYVTDDNAVTEYGKIYKTVIWDDVTVPSNLKKKGEEYLKSTQYEKMILELKAIDLGLKDEEINRLHIGSQVRCISKPNGMDQWMPVSKLKINLTKFADNTFTLGSETNNTSYTSSNNQATANMLDTINMLPTKREIIEAAMRDATDLINDYTTRGHAIHTPNEFIISDTEGVEDATQLWRWGLGGLAHYSYGYDGPADGVAITMDGEINGKMIMAESILAESIDIGYRTEVETKIGNGDQYVVETLENSIKNVENRIDMNVFSTKNKLSRIEYVKDGEQETISLSSFKITGEATLTKEEFLKLNCLKLTFSNSGTMYLEQDLGSLPAGNYHIELTIAYPSDSNGRVNYRPNQISYGFSDWWITDPLSGYKPDTLYTLKTDVKITAEKKAIRIGVSGGNVGICYITNVRCMRDVREMIEHNEAQISLVSDSIAAEVTRASKAEGNLSSRITQTAEAITSKVTKGDVESLIEQKADSIRMKADKISWGSVYSAMTEDGKLSCRNAEVSGKVLSGDKNSRWVYLDGEGRLTAGYQDLEYGSIDGSYPNDGLSINGNKILILADHFAIGTNNPQVGYATAADKTIEYISSIDIQDEKVTYEKKTMRFKNGIMIMS